MNENEYITQPPLSAPLTDTTETSLVSPVSPAPPKKNKIIIIIAAIGVIALITNIVLLFFLLSRSAEEPLTCTKTANIFGLQYEIKYDIIFEGENTESMYMTVTYADLAGLFPDIGEQLQKSVTQINEKGGDVHVNKSGNSYIVEGNIPVEAMIDGDLGDPTELLTKTGLTAYLDEQAYVCTGPSTQDDEAEAAEKTNKTKGDISSYLEKKYGKNDFEITDIDSKDRTSCQYGSCKKVSPRITDYAAKVHSEAQNIDFTVQASFYSENNETAFQDSLLQGLTIRQFDTDVQKLVKELYGTVEELSYESAYYSGRGASMNSIDPEDPYFSSGELEASMEDTRSTSIDSAPFEFLKNHKTGLNIRIQLNRDQLSKEAELEKLTDFVLGLVGKGWFENYGFDIAIQFKEPNVAAYAFMASSYGDNQSKDFSIDKCTIDTGPKVILRGPANNARNKER